MSYIKNLALYLEPKTDFILFWGILLRRLDMNTEVELLTSELRFQNASEHLKYGLSWVCRSLISEVASIVKSNIGDQPSLPRNLENMVRQECRKEHARERLRKKHEMRKVKSFQAEKHNRHEMLMYRKKRAGIPSVENKNAQIYENYMTLIIIGIYRILVELLALYWTVLTKDPAQQAKRKILYVLMHIYFVSSTAKYVLASFSVSLWSTVYS